LLALGTALGAVACTTEIGDDGGGETGGAAGSMIAGSAGIAGSGAGFAGAAAQAGSGAGGSASGAGGFAGSASGSSGTSGSAGMLSTGGSSGVGGVNNGAGGSSAGATGFGGSSGSANGTGGSSGNAGGTSGSGGSAGGSGGSAGTGVVPEEPYCAVTEAWDPAYAALEAEIVTIVNRYRAEGATCGGDEMEPVGPLTMDPNLQCAARVHTKDMADRDFFDHTNPDGDGPDDRMEAAGYDGRGWGENIAAGNSEAEETMEQWMNSDGHCRNIMNGSYTLIGVGYYPGGEYDHLWTQTFGG
jgi:uncharacterized protein YkwD